LPSIGPARARSIVEYRNLPDVDKPAFKCASDMEKIKGIGPKTVEKLEPYLVFDKQ
jgi:competence protein ComEA